MCSITCSAEANDPLNGMFENKLEPKFDSPKAMEHYCSDAMHNVQRAVEFYASHHRGQLPTAIDNAFKSYMPFGEADDREFSPMSAPYNPLAHKREWPVMGKFKTLAAAKSKTDHVQPGTIEYGLVGKDDYAIRCGDASGHPLTDKSAGGKGDVLVYSRTEREAQIANMRTVEWAVERYAEDHMGKYPKSIDNDFKMCMPNGDANKKVVGNQLLNTCNHKLEWPVLGTISNITRARRAEPIPMPAGQIEYSCVGDNNYAIRAGACIGKALSNDERKSKTYVLAKDGDGGGFGW